MAGDGEATAKLPMLPDAGGEGRDLISALPDDLLIAVLVRLPTAEAIRTCLLSRRWRTLWTHLQVLMFFDKDPSLGRLSFTDLVDGALRCRGQGDLSRLVIGITDKSNIDAARFDAWARVAALRITGPLEIVVLVPGDDDERMVLELPCCARATEICVGLNRAGLRLPMPGAGEFACLTKMDLCNLRFTAAGPAPGDVLSSCCPQLETLCLMGIWGMDELRLHTRSLLLLRLSFIAELKRLDVVASKLRRMEVACCFLGKGGEAMSLCAPMLEVVHWQGICPSDIQFGVIRCIRKLSAGEIVSKILQHMGRHSNFIKILQHFRHTDRLALHIPIPDDIQGHKNLMEDIKLPCHLELKLVVTPNGHAFGAGMVSLLKRCSGIRKLKVSLDYSERHNACPSNCICGQPPCWRDKEICFNSLEELVVKNFRGWRDEKDFLYFIFKCANVLKRVAIVSCSKTKELCSEITSFLPVGCSVVCQ